MPRIITNLWHDTEAVSLLIDCADQTEVDQYWDTLAVGGETGHCGLAQGPLRLVVAGVP